MGRNLLTLAAQALQPLMPQQTDPRKLKPGQLVRLLNSTPLGPVLSDRKLRTQRETAGLRIGDGQTVDLFRYAAWLFGQWQESGIGKRESGDRVDRASLAATGVDADPASPTAPVSADADKYTAKKERERARNSAASRSGRDVGEIPAVANPARRAAAEGHLRTFLLTYLAHWFPKPFSPDQEDLIDEIQHVGDEGGLKAYALPRGSGKTTICEGSVLWAALKGRRRFIAFIGASRDGASESLDTLKGELETNDLLAADWPEVCAPIRKLEGIANRCAGQHHQGQRTYIQWSGTTLVLPTIAGSRASGVVICVRGITGRIRGMKFRRADGTLARPDLAIIDDPQTDASAHSELLCGKRLKTVTQAILGLPGPGEKIAALMPCTIIVPGDMAAQILDRTKHPEWHGVVRKLIYDFPTRQDLWDQYADIRRRDMQAGGDGAPATEFYRANRADMDRGGRVAWEARFEPGELSALQNAMNLLIDRGEEAFAAEYQNAPQVREETDTELATVEQIETKVNGLARGVVPLAATKLTAFIDVQHSLLYWLVTAWRDDFTGAIIDYGAFPDQGRGHFQLRGARKTLAKAFPGMSTAAAVLAGLDALVGQMLARRFDIEGGGQGFIERLLIDSKDGTLSAELIEFCRNHPQAARIFPSEGKGIGPADTPMHQYKVQPGEKIGDHWLLKKATKQAARKIVIDTNYWKTFVHARLLAPVGDKGCLTLFGLKKKTDHRLLAEHLHGEKPERIRHEKTGRTGDVWKLKSHKPDNHWLDGLAGAAVAASYQGCRLIPQPGATMRKKISLRAIREKQPPAPGTLTVGPPTEPAEPRKKISLREIRERRRGQR